MNDYFESMPDIEDIEHNDNWQELQAQDAEKLMAEEEAWMQSPEQRLKKAIEDYWSECSKDYKHYRFKLKVQTLCANVEATNFDQTDFDIQYNELVRRYPAAIVSHDSIKKIVEGVTW